MIGLSKYKRIHCLGIGGVGLSAIAEILLDQGHIVSGSDMNRSQITQKLEEKGIKVYYNHASENVMNAELVVYSAAVSADNPEMTMAEKLRIPRISRAEILGELMANYKRSIAICGTHGKTTVTSMTSLILKNADYSPTILVGGNLEEINGNVEIGSSDIFITEACEYMDSFLSLSPKVGVVLNIDSDHLDYFKNIENIKSSFKQFVNQVADDGVVIAYDGNPFVKDVLKEVKNKITYGYFEVNDYYAENIHFDDVGFPEFDVCRKGKKITHLHLSVPGEHNVLNAMAAFSTASYLGVPIEDIKKTLENFKGTHRRFDIVGVTENGVQIIDDYAHHPTEIKATLKAVKNVKHKKTWCIFQPHTFTRTKALFDEFVDAFEGLDNLILTDIYAAREKDIYGISSEILAKKIKEKYKEKNVLYIKDFEEIANYLRTQAVAGDIVMTMGAGDVYKIGKILMKGRA